MYSFQLERNSEMIYLRVLRVGWPKYGHDTNKKCCPGHFKPKCHHVLMLSNAGVWMHVFHVWYYLVTYSNLSSYLFRFIFIFIQIPSIVYLHLSVCLLRFICCQIYLLTYLHLFISIYLLIYLFIFMCLHSSLNCTRRKLLYKKKIRTI